MLESGKKSAELLGKASGKIFEAEGKLGELESAKSELHKKLMEVSGDLQVPSSYRPCTGLNPGNTPGWLAGCLPACLAAWCRLRLLLTTGVCVWRQGQIAGVEANVSAMSDLVNALQATKPTPAVL
jgi:hypothetical protein